MKGPAKSLIDRIERLERRISSKHSEPQQNIMVPLTLFGGVHYLRQNIDSIDYRLDANSVLYKKTGFEWAEVYPTGKKQPPKLPWSEEPPSHRRIAEETGRLFDEKGYSAVIEKHLVKRAKMYGLKLDDDYIRWQLGTCQSDGSARGIINEE